MFPPYSHLYMYFKKTSIFVYFSFYCATVIGSGKMCHQHFPLVLLNISYLVSQFQASMFSDSWSNSQLMTVFKVTEKIGIIIRTSIYEYSLSTHLNMCPYPLSSLLTKTVPVLCRVNLLTCVLDPMSSYPL